MYTPELQEADLRVRELRAGDERTQADAASASPVELARYDNGWYDPGASLPRRMAWFLLGEPVLRAAWIPFSGLRVALLRLFGARIGQGVVIKPSVEVKYPWHLRVGDHVWIGEHVWIDNLVTVTLASNVCVSQGAYLCTGNHDWSDPHFGLRVAPVTLREGAWAGARAVLLPGTELERGAVAGAGAVVSGRVPAFEVHAGNPAQFVRQRRMRAQPAETTQPLATAGARPATQEPSPV